MLVGTPVTVRNKIIMRIEEHFKISNDRKLNIRFPKIRSLSMCEETKMFLNLRLLANVPQDPGTQDPTFFQV